MVCGIWGQLETLPGLFATEPYRSQYSHVSLASWNSTGLSALRRFLLPRPRTAGPMPHGLFMRFDDISNGEKGKSVLSCTNLNLALIDWSVFIIDVVQLIAIAISWLDNPQEKTCTMMMANLGLYQQQTSNGLRLGQPVRIKTADTDRRIYDVFFFTRLMGLIHYYKLYILPLL